MAVILNLTLLDYVLDTNGHFIISLLRNIMIYGEAKWQPLYAKVENHLLVAEALNRGHFLAWPIGSV
jgi:hypothetical protein